jgi:predicted tellurium resistance membrane protein TerC
VAGAAREHPGILVFGLLLSIALMGLAANAIAKLLHKHRWIGFVGLAIVLYVALHMIWEGHRSVVMDLHKTEQYNAAAPNVIDIKPGEVADHEKHR